MPRGVVAKSGLKKGEVRKPVRIRIKKEDTVKVITGRDKGKTGRVLEVNRITGRILVEGIMMSKKHTRPNPAKQIKGGIAEREGTIHASNVMVVTPDGKPTRVATRVENVGGKVRRVRIGASTTVLRDHLPELVEYVRKKYPNLKVALREGYHPDLESLLQREELDLAVTLIQKKSGPGIHSLELIKLPLVLLVKKDSPLSAAEELWERDKIEEPLICLPASEAICKNFQQGLARLGVDWFPSIEVSSVDLIETYVANGFGIGVSVLVPKASLSPKVRTLPLAEFEPVIMGALWRGKTSALLQTFVDALKLRARQLS